MTKTIRGILLHEGPITGDVSDVVKGWVVMQSKHMLGPIPGPMIDADIPFMKLSYNFNDTKVDIYKREGNLAIYASHNTEPAKALTDTLYELGMQEELASNF